ncbi:DNA polymerase IV [Fusarium verticillioides 7600]|uniref:DNA polymerase n=1 Tax=Gibberella moniliformis (strain M3125 / FGSC 7600) TaxID=334819 RepID=W7M835_GIBM7|nr:DNA polymerase IV [Fusarium verticillioides 7600]EWG47161.1 DNA polymerase IV [Fusarium verticillioides 7600]
MRLDNLPRIFLLPTHLKPEELHELEDRIPTLTYDINEAEIVLGKISQQRRAEFELRRAKFEFASVKEPQTESHHVDSPAVADDSRGSPDPQRRRVKEQTEVGTDIVKVVKLSWLLDSWEKEELLPVDHYLIFQCNRVLPRETTPATVLPKGSTSPASSILERALLEQKAQSTSTSPSNRHKRRHDASATLSQNAPSLLHQTTSEHDTTLPVIPEFLRTTYSCQRPTYMNPPNEAFVNILAEIRTIRRLREDEVGVRAYSTSIASIAAYPYVLGNAQEVARLPGCGDRIAELWHHWKETGESVEVREANADPKITVLQLFYNIWGVGAVTAREFYQKGWRDLDDLVEFGWNMLSRSQQLGVKFYNEFSQGIPRDEVAAIAAAILEHARLIDPGFEMVIVGGYRRGKQLSGDADVVLSHRNENKTLNVITKIVVALEKAQLITHTLTLSTHNSDRGQRPVSWKGEKSNGSGFDTLDKALVVWQDSSKNGAPHRRVDIIISPWKTVGCAVLGWSGGTTFQRDVRRYCKKAKGYKFDSSGIRRRADGRWVDLEGTSGGDEAPDMETAERRVFAGLGLQWRSPEERCTG